MIYYHRICTLAIGNTCKHAPGSDYLLCVHSYYLLCASATHWTCTIKPVRGTPIIPSAFLPLGDHSWTVCTLRTTCDLQLSTDDIAIVIVLLVVFAVHETTASLYLWTSLDSARDLCGVWNGTY